MSFDIEAHRRRTAPAAARIHARTLGLGANIERLIAEKEEALQRARVAERRLMQVQDDRDTLLESAEKVVTNRPPAVNEMVFVVSRVQSAISYRQEGSW